MLCAFLRIFAERQPATVLIKACGSAHHWGRQLQALVHRVLLLPPQHTRPYVTGNKTDRSDAKGLDCWPPTTCILYRILKHLELCVVRWSLPD